MIAKKSVLFFYEYLVHISMVLMYDSLGDQLLIWSYTREMITHCGDVEMIKGDNQESLYSKFPLAIYFTCGNIYVSILFSQVTMQVTQSWCSVMT